MLRRALLAVARSDTIKKATTRAPIARDVVRRFVPGETGDDAVVATRQLAGAGLSVILDHLGEDTRPDSRLMRSSSPIWTCLSGSKKPA